MNYAAGWTGRTDAGAEQRGHVVVVNVGGVQVGLVVDFLVGQEEVVIKPLVDYLQERSGFSGATILGDGRISLILDVYELVNLTIDRRSARLGAISRGAGRPDPDGRTRPGSQR